MWSTDTLPFPPPSLSTRVIVDRSSLNSSHRRALRIGGSRWKHLCDRFPRSEARGMIQPITMKKETRTSKIHIITNHQTLTNHMRSPVAICATWQLALYPVMRQSFSRNRCKSRTPRIPLLLQLPLPEHQELAASTLSQRRTAT
jgi:hypothetical protein